MQNKLAPLSANALNFVCNCAYNWLSVAEGGKRGGKDIASVKAFCRALETHPNKLHLAAGVSVAAAKLNIIHSDGYGLLNYFYGRCRQGKFQEREAVYVQTLTGEKIVLISGGGKAGDERLIKGNTYGMAIITEANECTPEFLQEVFDRTISSAARKIWHTLNPKAPKHWYYEKILDFHQAEQAKNKDYGLNYGHFTIADNLSISDEQIRTVLKTYDKKSVWFKRDILGQRAVAEGGMFLQFAANPSKWLIAAPAQRYQKLFVGVDFGGNKAKTVFILIGITSVNNRPEIHILAEHIVKNNGYGIDSNQISTEHKKFFMGCIEKYNQLPEKSFTDHNFLAFTIQLGKDIGDTSLVRLVSKRIVSKEWALNINALFNTGRLKIVKDCKQVINMFCGMLFDPKKTDDSPLDDGTCENDIYDATRYAMSQTMENWILNGIIRNGGN